MCGGRISMSLPPYRVPPDINLIPNKPRKAPPKRKMKRKHSTGDLLILLKKLKVSPSQAAMKNKLKVAIKKSMTPTYSGIKMRSNFKASKRDDAAGLR